MRNETIVAILSTLLLAASSPALAQEAISDWPQDQRKAVQEMTDKYGEPDGVTSSRAVWTEPDGDWEEIIVFREKVDHNWPKPHQDYVEQAIYHEVPADKMDELSEFDGSVIVYRTEGRLAARCDMEGANYLALNLAHDIITDEKSVEEARQAYEEAVQQMMAGNPPDIMQGLVFEPMSREQAFSADVAAIQQ